MSAPEPRSPLAGRLAPGRFGAAAEAPVRIGQRHAAIVQIAARRGRAPTLAAALQDGIGLALPPPGRAGAAGLVSALWLQPDAWLLVGPQESDGALAQAIAATAGAAAAVVDQTHGRSIVTLAGGAATLVLSRLCRLDLHARSFPPGSVAATPVAELPCLLHRANEGGAANDRAANDRADDTPHFETVVFATFAAAFLHRLTEAAAGFGYEIIG